MTVALFGITNDGLNLAVNLLILFLVVIYLALAYWTYADAPLTIFDGAHNPSGVAALASALRDAVGEKPLVAVLSVLDDKDAAGMLRELVPLASGAVFTASRNPRALSPATLSSLWDQLGGPTAEIEGDPRQAVERAQAIAGEEGAVVATGSIYLVADLLAEPGRRRASAL